MANSSLVERINQEIAFQRKMAKEYESGIYKNDVVSARYDQAAKILEWVSGLVAQDQEKPDDASESKVNKGGMLENKIKANEGYKITVSETYTASRSGQMSRIVLGVKDTSFGKMFVTWESTAWLLSNGSEKADYYWGHYFDDERKARADYHRRLVEKYEGYRR